MYTIYIKRIYDEPSDKDGCRILVDRRWPGGVSKKDANLNEWNKEITPSTELRKWFDHKEERFEEFARRYRLELKEKKELLNVLRQAAKHETVSLMYATKNPEINHDVVPKDVLLKKNNTA